MILDLNRRTVTLQLFVFVTQWTLMIAGFGLLALEIAPINLVPSFIPFHRVVDAGVKGLIALALSAVWLFVWDGQVRFFFYRREK